VDTIRRYHRKNRITDILLLDNKIIIVYSLRIEAVIVTSAGKAVLTHYLTLTDARIITTFISNDNIFSIIGVAATGVFERELSLSFYE